MTKLFSLLTFLAVFCCTSCANTDTNGIQNTPDASVESSITMENDRVTELFREDDSTNEYKRIRVYFCVPVDFSYEEVREHASNFIETIKNEHSDIVVLSLWYYDNEIYLEYGDNVAALVLWAPHGSYYNYHDIPVGDYSTHITIIDFTDYDERYELDEREIELYSALQSYAKEQTGKYIVGFYDINESVGDLSIYEYVAERYDTTVEELMNIRIKATMRRMYPMG